VEEIGKSRAARVNIGWRTNCMAATLPKSNSGARKSPGRWAIAIMAAGKGTRLKSRHPKVLHQIGGKSLLEHVIAAALRIAEPSDVYAIVGHEADRVRQQTEHTGVNFVLQVPQLGTGHAIMAAAGSLAPYQHVIVLSGDAPLVQPDTIARLRDFHLQSRAAMTILTAEVADPQGYGRVVRRTRTKPDVSAIVEEKALPPAQRKLREINSGIYAFTTQPLLANLNKLSTKNTHGEYYLTDIAALLVKSKQKVVALAAADAKEVLGSNTRAELSLLDVELRAAKCRELMAAGVSIFYPETCVIDSDVEVGADTVIEPFVQLLGKTRIGSDCRIRSYSVISNSQIGDEVVVRPGCVIDQTKVANGARIGPYAHLRPETVLAEGTHVGNFVETKKARLGKGSKANHLTYLGDAEVGDGVNVGAGTITCNYDGVNKHMTYIEDGAFIGSDSTLVAPVRIGRQAYVGAGSTITDDVPPESLALGRGRQVIKEGWVRERKSRQTAQKATAKK
jgi:bifunctional UDP-N-acetylglucosamine pyrophosphorylase/glucosamine-1-phosphate N-acetyltransferase